MKKIVQGCALALGLVAVSLSSYADKVYRSVDEQGNVIFTDTPQPNAQEVTLPPLQSYTSPETNTGVSGTQRFKNRLKQPAIQYSLSIVSPQNEATIWDNEGNVLVVVTTNPPLDGQLQLEILVDGLKMSASGQRTSVQLTGLERGTHQIQAQLVDGNGGVVVTSEPVIIYIQKTSLLAPARRILPPP